MFEGSAKAWADDLVADAELGDVRRTRLVARMLRRMAEQPAGCITDVFDQKAAQQAAYDFIEGDVRSEALLDAFASSAMRACRDAGRCLVIVDGTSLTLTDRGGRKGFGSVGKREFPTRGLKVIDALAVSTSGMPLGLLEMRFWAREPASKLSRFVRRRDRLCETQHWVEAIEHARNRARAAGVTPWFVIDREGDAGDILRAVACKGSDFTVRVSQFRRLCRDGVVEGSLLSRMNRRAVIGRHFVEVPPRDGRPARVAALDVRVGHVVLQLPDHRTGERTAFPTYVVWACERSAPRSSEKLEWMLFTSIEVATYEDAVRVIDSYCLRWRVEDFHSSWKGGHCRVEETQLRSLDRVVRWATMLAAVAVRAEQLKHLSREKPDAPASTALSEIEIEALIAKRNAQVRKDGPPIRGMPSLAQAVWWIAEMGGHPGNPAAGLPGARRIARGLERLLAYAEGFAAGRRER